MTDFHNTVLKLVFNGDGNCLFHDPPFTFDEEESPKTVAMASKWSQLIFTISWDLRMSISTEPFYAHVSWIADNRNDQEGEGSLLYLSMYFFVSADFLLPP